MDLSLVVFSSLLLGDVAAVAVLLQPLLLLLTAAFLVLRTGLLGAGCFFSTEMSVCVPASPEPTCCCCCCPLRKLSTLRRSLPVELTRELDLRNDVVGFLPAPSVVGMSYDKICFNP